MKKICVLLLLLKASINFGQVAYPKILPMKDRSAVIDRLLADKVEKVLPDLMRETGIDMWVVISREYNEDPVIETLLPATWLAARRRTILVMYDQGEGKGVETLAVARYDVGDVFKSAWDKEKQPDQWVRLREIIEERNPEKIGVNKSEHFGLADGITATDYEALQKALPEKYRKRIVSAEKLAIGWLETRTEAEMELYPHICRIAHEIIAEAFSEKVIQPGVTTTSDVEWWMWEKVKALKLKTWFHPTVDIQSSAPQSEASVSHTKDVSNVIDVQNKDSKSVEIEKSLLSNKNQNIIQPGDLLHCDFGVTYLRLNTDTQQLAYVLKPGETDAPQYLKDALAVGNRLQDIFTSNFKQGKTGNEVLKASREQAIEEGIKPSIYTHPIGYHGHAAGTTLGMWDAQDGVPFTGDYPLHLNTAYSIELNATTHIDEWDRDIRVMLEEEAFFDENGVQYIDGRQTELIIIGN